MGPIIHVVRHAHGLHQVAQNQNLHDPELTDLGHTQCQELATEMAKLGPIELVIASPMKRTIQTALETFGDYTQSKRIVLHPGLQETDTMPSSIGSPLGEVIREYGNQPLDFFYMTDDWSDKSCGSRYHPNHVAFRALSMRLFLRTIAQRYRDTNANIVVVSHANFIAYLTDDYGHLFKNTEYRSYQFDFAANVEDYPKAQLIEITGSIARREKVADETAAIISAELPSVVGLKIPVPEIKPPDTVMPSWPGTIPTYEEETGEEMEDGAPTAKDLFAPMPTAAPPKLLDLPDKKLVTGSWSKSKEIRPLTVESFVSNPNFLKSDFTAGKRSWDLPHWTAHNQKK